MLEDDMQIIFPCFNKQFKCAGILILVRPTNSYWKLEIRISNYRLNGPRITEPGYTCVTTFQMMPIAARQDRGHYSNLFSVHYSEGNIFHVTSENTFEGAFSVFVPTVEKQARICGRNNASLLTASNSRFNSASQAISNEKAMVS